MPSLFDDLPDLPAEELTETLLTGRQFRVERIVSTGQSSPPDFWYDQPENEWVLVVSGFGVLRFADSAELVELAEGDYVQIPAHRKHRVEATDQDHPTVWLAIHYQ